MNTKKEGIRLIDKLYRDLYKSDAVIHHKPHNLYDKFNNIEIYLNKLEAIHNEGRHIDYLKKMYYDKYVIKRENIPESYYNMQIEIALERGYGHTKLTEKVRKELQDEVIENQQSKIDIWLDYFLSEDSNMYPFWMKYWAFQGMVKLGKYNKAKEKFYKRTKQTVEPFVDLNREALSMSMDLIIKMLKKEKIDDKELEVLVKSGSFQKIYTHLLTKVLIDSKNITKRNIGKWVKYNRGNDYMPLVNSLQGYNTGWCTRGEKTAKTQLKNGDFYVYYTQDENDEYKVPRIAIRMLDNKIAEIRGIAENQNLEPDMEKIVEEKIKDFPDKDEYYKKVNDMRLLTKIYKKHQSKKELLIEELRFLYEIDNKIKGFGYEKDPRINEIKQERNFKKDLSFIFNCKEDQIALKKEDINSDTIYYDGDLDLRNLTSAKDLNLPQYIRGNLNLQSLISAEGLVLPKGIGGSLYLKSLGSTEGLIFPKKVGDSIYLDSLRNAEGLVLPESIGGSLYLKNLTSAEGVELPQIIGKSLNLDSLTSAEGLVLPKRIGDDLYLGSLTSAEGLVFPESIGGSLVLCRLISVKDLVFPQSIGRSIDLRSLTSAEGLVFPKSIGGSVHLDSLTSAKNLILPQYIGENLYLRGLTNIEGLSFPEPLTYNIHMHNFIITPKNVEQYRNNCLILKKTKNT